MKKRIILQCAFILLFLLPGVLASYQYYNNTIKTDYLGGEKLQGIITIGLVNQSSNSYITTNLGGNKSMISFLADNNLSEGEDYNCTTIGCMPDYSIVNEISSINLESDNQTFIAGFQIKGSDITIDKISLTLTGNANPSCTEDLLIDVANIQKAFFTNPKYTSVPCSPIRRGCFNPNLSESSYLKSTLGNNRYCEKITLPPAPAYLVGAKIKNSTSGKADIKIEIFSPDFDFSLGSCILPKNAQDEETLSCVVNATNAKRDDFFVCISSSGGNYKIRVETQDETCGRADDGPLDKDYDLFAQTMQFDYLSLEFTENLFSKINRDISLIDFVNDYISERYERNCPLAGCFIPLKITGKPQMILIKNPLVEYSWGGSNLESTSLNKLVMSSAKISSKPLALDVSKLDVALPLQSNASTLQIYIDGKPLINRTTALKINPSFSFNVYPMFVLIGFESVFNATTSSDITSSSWDFGDGKTGEAGGKSISHIYTQQGNYTLKVTLNRNDGVKASKTFEIMVGDANASAIMLLDKYEKRIANLTKQISLLQPWVREEVEKKVDIVSLNASVTKIRNDYEISTTEDEIVNAINKLLQINVPVAIVDKEVGTYPLSIGFNDIDVSYIEEISARNSQDKEQLALNIINWIGKSYDGSIKRTLISLIGEKSSEDLMTIFSINLAPKQETGLKPYLIIDYPYEGMKFKDSLNSRAVNSGTSVPLSEGQTLNVEFLINQKIEAKQLGAYVSPEIGVLAVDTSAIEPEEGFGYLRFFGFLGLIALGLLVVYIILYEWYKKYYESYLFKTKDMLYNLLAFINNSRVARIDDSAIEKNLSRAGWSGEQISYAFRRIDGKRTGMWEIPLLRIFEKKKLNEELAKRRVNGAGMRGLGQNARFIKR